MWKSKAKVERGEINSFPKTVLAGLEGELVSYPQCDDVFHVLCALSVQWLGGKHIGNHFLSFSLPLKGKCCTEQKRFIRLRTCICVSINWK